MTPMRQTLLAIVAQAAANLDAILFEQRPPESDDIGDTFGYAKRYDHWQLMLRLSQWCQPNRRRARAQRRSVQGVACIAAYPALRRA